ncbi:protein kinase [Nocardia tengchongensis]|uniref:serine/threonine-protein kinase n=1 Tax=Nocardia tengchongensis TaxID=2055889 RepID=UPI00369A2B48
MPGAGNLGHYRLVELLGRGGMGQVWLAEDTRLEREVALKLLPAELAEDEDYRRRFEREARLAARLRGPHVVPIHAFGELDGRLYIDMELIEGSDLGKRLREEGSLPPARAVDLVSQVAAALDIAHQAGLVHRDVKPSNVITLPSGFAYLIDFGIARGVGQATITGTGVAVGTWAYMAPERYSGTEDLRSDVYSLACLLYETLTGAKPFAHADPVQQMAAHVTSEPPRASDRNSLIPAALDAVIIRGMAKDPDRRHPSAGALAAAARAALEAAPAVRPGPPRRSDPTTKWDDGDRFPSHGSTSGAQYPPYTPPPARDRSAAAQPPTPHSGNPAGATPPPSRFGAGTTPPPNRMGMGATPSPTGTPSGPTPAPNRSGSGATPPPSRIAMGATPPPGRVGPGATPAPTGPGAGATPSPTGMSAGATPLPGGMAGATPQPGGKASVTPLPGGMASAIPQPGGMASATPPPGSMAAGAAPLPGGMSAGMPNQPGGMGFVSQYAPGYAAMAAKPVQRRGIRPWQPVWWAVLGLCLLFFAIMSAGVLAVTFAEGFGDAGTTVIAYVIFVGPLLAFIWVTVLEVRRFRARRR